MLLYKTFGRKDIAKLIPIKVTDKRGRVVTVYKRLSPDPSKYGIKKLRDGATLGWLRDNHKWILSANIENAVIGRDHKTNNVVWYDGIWHYGAWRGGKWRGGIFEDGRWFNGIWYNGEWKNGDFMGGLWLNGTWENGIHHDGIWMNGTWKGGSWVGGEWFGGKWKGGYDYKSMYRAEDESPDTWE